MICACTDPETKRIEPACFAHATVNRLVSAIPCLPLLEPQLMSMYSESG